MSILERLDTIEQRQIDQGEDIAFIRGKLEGQGDLESRVRSLERWKWGLPITAVLAFFGLHTTN